MRKSNQVTTGEIRSVFRLIHECCEMGNDVVRWRRHMLAGLIKLLNAFYGNATLCTYPINVGSFHPLVYVFEGIDEPEFARIWAEYIAMADLRGNPCTDGFSKLLMGGFCRLRQQVSDDRTWYMSDYFNCVQRKIKSDGTLYAQFVLPRTGVTVGVGFTRRIGEPEFGERQHRILALFNAELARLFQRQVSDPRDDLPPRLAEVLSFLSGGDGEKQIARQMALSRGTVHKYVTALYRHFDVNSRPELIAKVRPQRAFCPQLLPSRSNGS